MRAFLLALLLLGMATFVQATVPKSAGYVTDEAGILTPDQIASLRSALSEYEQRTSNQIVVLTIKSLEGQDIASYGIEVAEAWKAGQEKKDNGVILLVAPNDKKVRIEVGYGLEGVLTDAKSAQIIRDVIRPHFRENDFYGGISNAITAIEAVIAGEYTADPKKHQSANPFLFIIIMLVLFVMRFFTSFGRQNSFYGGGWSGGSGFGGSGGFGGGSGFGGFSGGGGGFGGGGASGRW